MIAPFFLDSLDDRIHCARFFPSPDVDCTGCVVIVPPWAEEMNHSRQMFALLGNALAKKGVVTVLPDLFGTGDSAGEFGEARWELWRRNIRDVVAWVTENVAKHFVFLGVRTGALLACDVAQGLPRPPTGLLLWQPINQGRTFLTQFLRMRLAASMSDRGERLTTSEFRARLAAGEKIEVAGYVLAPELVRTMDRLDLSALAPTVERGVGWVELSATSAARPSAASLVTIEAWRLLGTEVRFFSLEGGAFWSAHEGLVVPELTECSVDFVGNLLA